MKAKIIALTVLIIVGFVYPTFAQNSNTKETKSDEDEFFDLFDEDLSEYAVKKLDGDRFVVEDFDGIDVTANTKALKTPNGLDLLFYEQKSGVTSICYNFYSSETKIDKWLDCKLLPESPTEIYWVLSNDFKNFGLVHQGSYLDMTGIKLKPSPTGQNEYIVQESGVDVYLMKDLKGKNLDEFYPLELLSQ